VNLARERGAFPIYDAAREEGNPFIQRLREADPALYADMVKYGRRNIALLTIAPTGTTSLMTQSRPRAWNRCFRFRTNAGKK
jgi:ribonucleoside-diphosphate reductase alpha chain